MSIFEVDHDTQKYVVVWVNNSSMNVHTGEDAGTCGMLPQTYGKMGQTYQGAIIPNAQTLSVNSLQTCGIFDSSPTSIIIQGFETDPTLNPNMYDQTPIYSFIFNNDLNGNWPSCNPYSNFAMNSQSPSDKNQNKYICSTGSTMDEQGDTQFGLYITGPVS